MDITKEEADLAIYKWGKEKQTDMLIEEIGEFLTAWNHYRRGRISIEDYVSEIADVYIMIQQMIYMNKDIFDKVYPMKLEKIRGKLKKIKEESDLIPKEPDLKSFWRRK